jgi:hypothetical protein
MSKIDKTLPNIDVRSIGSEEFVPEWENKMGL